MIDSDRLLSLDIGDGASKFNGAMNDSRRERQFPRCGSKKIFAALVEGNQFVDMF